MTINNKSERNYRGKCLGWPVTSYGADRVHINSNPYSNSDIHIIIMIHYINYVN